MTWAENRVALISLDHAGNWELESGVVMAWILRGMRDDVEPPS